MIRVFLAIAIGLHGIIHFIAYRPWYGLDKVANASMVRDALASPAWLFTGLLLLLSAYLYLKKQQYWWVVSLLAVLCSQVLVIQHWQVASVGTLFNVLLLLASVIGYQQWNFSRTTTKFVQLLLDQQSSSEKLPGKKVPPLVKRWVERSGQPDLFSVQSIRLVQRGEMRLAPEEDWFPFRAEQYTTTAPPGFVWTTHTQKSLWLHFLARDTYLHGHGQMLIKLFALFPVVNAKGAPIDQGALLRYLAEMIWYPAAAQYHYIQWTVRSKYSAEALMEWGEIAASAHFFFDTYGDVQRIEALRYYLNVEGEPELLPWRVEIDRDSYREFAGLRLPARATVIWHMQGRDFAWLKVEITQLQLNLFEKNNHHDKIYT